MSKLYPWIARHVVAPIHSQWEGTGYYQELSRLEQSQWFSPEDLKQLQTDRLRSILEFSKDHVPFYKNAISTQDLSNPWKCLARLPVIDKGQLQQEEHRFRASGPNTPMANLNATGGSTGQPFQFLVDKERWGTRKAATWRHNAWAHLTLGTAWGALWGQPLDFKSMGGMEAIRNRFLERMVPIDASALTSESLDVLMEMIKEKRISVLQAYGSALALFLRHVEDKNDRTLELKSIISSAEVLPPGTREKAKTLMNTKVFDRYGCREFSVVASECEFHSMHVNAEHLFVEILDGTRSVEAGQVGEVVITDLLNRSQPFLRYRLGDLATPVHEPCPCGRGLPRIRLLAGRTTEFIVTPTRGWVSGVSLATYLITGLEGVGQVRIEQDTMEEIILRGRPVPGVDFPAQKLKDRAKQFLGDGLNIRVVEDPELASEGSGKFRFSVSRFNPVGAPLSEVDKGDSP